MTLKKVVLEMITETKKYAEDIVQQSRNTNASKKYILSDYRLLGFVRQLCGTLPGALHGYSHCPDHEGIKTVSFGSCRKISKAI